LNLAIDTALGIGFALGLKHALDADHLAAVAVMVGDRRRSVMGASLVGVMWGAGHAASLSAVGLAVIVLGIQIPVRLASGMEVAAGVMLAFLGGRLLWSFRKGAVLHTHAHAHGSGEHRHPHVHPGGIGAEHPMHHALPAGAARIASGSPSMARPFAVGLVHGLAGSAALMLLVLAAIPDVFSRFVYVLLFAAGTIAGMGLMSALVGLPFLLGGGREGRVQGVLRMAAGAFSLLLGLAMVWGFSPDL